MKFLITDFAPQHYHSFPCLQRSLEYYQGILYNYATYCKNVNFVHATISLTSILTVEGDSYWCGVRSTSSPAVVLEMESTSRMLHTSHAQLNLIILFSKYIAEGPNVGVCSEDEVKSETSRMAINTCKYYGVGRHLATVYHK